MCGAAHRGGEPRAASRRQQDRKPWPNTSPLPIRMPHNKFALAECGPSIHDNRSKIALAPCRGPASGVVWTSAGRLRVPANDAVVVLSVLRARLCGGVV